MSGIIVNNYGSLPVVFAKGEGSELTDVNGKKYLDFAAGIGVNCLGHNHPALVRAVCTQAAKQIHVSNYYNSDAGLAYAALITKASGMDGVFFCNSGAEANESAIKLARKYGAMQDAKTGKPEGTRKTIVTLANSFHGRTVAALRATGQEKFHNSNFAPYPAGFRHIPANDFDSLKTVFDDTVCALLIECVQGEGGVNLIDKKWVQAAAEAANKAGALFMVDEVQTGMGRTGTLFACESLGIKPDVITLAKGIAGGIPMGACLFGRNAAGVFAAGDHQSTFGGNPLACAAACAVFKELTSDGFLSRVEEMGCRMRSVITDWKLSCITDVRGRGMMIGVDITVSPSEIQKKCLEAGLCVSTAGTKTVRFLPPLVLTQKQADEGLAIFKSVLETAAQM